VEWYRHSLRDVEAHPGPVVTSYSTCDSFPNRHLLNIDPEQYECLEPHEVWERCFDALQKMGRGLELRPDDWKDYYFDRGVTYMDLRAPDREARLEKKKFGVGK
jgi:hypothetical protein